MVNYKAILHIIQTITEKNSTPCKKTLQKMVFLIEAKQIDLGCNYGIHFYGPYSSDLDFAVREMCDEGLIEINYTPLEHKISAKEASCSSEYSNIVVDEIIEEFAKETPSELELLATTLYVYLIDKNTSEIVPRVTKIKGDKYSIQRIDNAIQRLKLTGYIAA